MPTSARWAVANSLKIAVNPVQFAGSMWTSTPTNGAVKGDRVPANSSCAAKNRAAAARFFCLQHTLDRVVQAADGKFVVRLLDGNDDVQFA